MKIHTIMKTKLVNSRPLILAIAILSLPLAISPTAQAGNMVSWTGAANFDDDEISFAGFIANQLTDISGPGYYHNHGSSGPVFELDIELDGNWTNIYSDAPVGSNIDYQISSITTPISFTQGTVTGLRWTSAPNVGQSYHGFSSATAFAFDNTQTVPEPTSLAMFCVGAAGCAFAGRIRRRKQR